MNTLDFFQTTQQYSPVFIGIISAIIYSSIAHIINGLNSNDHKTENNLKKLNNDFLKYQVQVSNEYARKHMVDSALQKIMDRFDNLFEEFHKIKKR